MTARVALMLGTIFSGVLAGCGEYDAAPPSLSQSSSPETVFLVHQEVFSIRLDGTALRSLGRVGDDKHRTASPRFLPDGRVAVLADDTGQIFPFVGEHQGGGWRAIRPMNVTINDGLCGVSINGASRLIYTTTPFLPVRTVLQRADVDADQIDHVAFEHQGVFFDPAPYDDGRVILVHGVAGETTLEIFDVSGPTNQGGARERLTTTTVASPLFNMSPGRLPDGRVAFIRVDNRDIYDNPIGRIMVLQPSGDVRPTDFTDVASLVVVDDRVVYEHLSQKDGSTDLMVTDLDGGPASNLTNTPYLNEHLGWSD